MNNQSKDPLGLADAPTGKAKGGVARAAALSSEERRSIAQQAALARWGDKDNLSKAAYLGEMKIGDMIFPCSVLTDGTRILTQSDFMTGMGMYYSGWVAKNRAMEDISADVPHFLSFSTLKPFIPKHLGDLQSITVRYRTVGGKVALGIKAEIIPKICEIWLDADEQVVLGKRQKAIAQKAKILMRALAHVGIIALVDEATGYQEIRDKKALAEILDQYLRKEFAAWAKRFPDEFYKQIFRLRGWQWRGMRVNRPQVVAKYTNDFVWSRIAPGLLSELQKRNPPNEKGRRQGSNAQLLTDDIGIPALNQHLHTVIAFMKAAESWDQFKKMLNIALPQRGDKLQMELFNAEFGSIEQQRLS